MPAIKDHNVIAAKWARRAGSAGAEYEEGVKNPRKDWAEQTANAESTYEQGVTAAIGRKAFGKGVKKTGTAGWQENAIAKGPTRYASGVALAQDKYIDGFAPFAAIIAATKLPARGPKGDPKNINRVQVMAKALHDKKIELEGR